MIVRRSLFQFNEPTVSLAMNLTEWALHSESHPCTPQLYSVFPNRTTIDAYCRCHCWYVFLFLAHVLVGEGGRLRQLGHKGKSTHWTRCQYMGCQSTSNITVGQSQSRGEIWTLSSEGQDNSAAVPQLILNVESNLSISLDCFKEWVDNGTFLFCLILVSSLFQASPAPIIVNTETLETVPYVSTRGSFNTVITLKNCILL